MKLILTILSLFAVPVFATNYYITNSGSDANSGTSAGAAWQTIHKVNTYSLSPGFVAGDSIFLKRDDTFNDSLRFYSSGSVGNPIVISCYGTGNLPIITGFQALIMTNIGGNVWQGAATNAGDYLNTVLINDSIGIKGRYPNSVVFTYTTATTSYILIPHTATDYTGKEIVVNGSSWDIGLTKIASQHTGSPNDTLFYTKPIQYPSGRGGNGYFFQNDVSYVDSAKEWCYNNATKVLTVYSTITPVVKYSSVDTLVKIHKKSNITFDNIVFSGANTYTLIADSFRNITVQNCTISNVSEGVHLFGDNGFKFDNNSVLFCLNNAISSTRDTGLTVTNNLFKNIGSYAGMGKGFQDTYPSPGFDQGFTQTGYTCIYNHNDNFLISGNRFISIGYIPIYFTGRNSSITKNYFKDYCLIKSDGGAINTWASSVNNADSGTVISKNIIESDTTHPNGLSTGFEIRAGIYLDQYVTYVTVDSNSISNTQYGIFTKGRNNTISNNIIYDSIGQYNIKCTDISGSNTIKKNTIYNFNPKKMFFGVYKSWALNLDFYDSTYEAIDSNHYIYLTGTQLLYSMGISGYIASTFKVKCVNYDVHANYSLPETSISNAARYIANNSLSDSAYTLAGNYVDQDGNLYYNSAILKPFTSKLLFPSSVVSYNGFYMGGHKFK